MKSLLRHAGHLLMMSAIFGAGCLAGSGRSHDASALRPASLPGAEKPAQQPDTHSFSRKTPRLLV